MRHLSGSRPEHVTDRHWLRLRAVADEVHRRTGCHCWYDLYRHQVCFGYTYPSGGYELIGGLDFPAFKCRTEPHPVTGNPRLVPDFNVPMQFDPAMDGVGVDDICYAIQLGRVDPRKKEQWAAQMKARQEQERIEAEGRFKQDEIVPEAQRVLRYQRNKAGMSSRYRPSAIVNGFKDN